MLCWCSGFLKSKSLEDFFFFPSVEEMTVHPLWDGDFDQWGRGVCKELCYTSRLQSDEDPVYVLCAEGGITPKYRVGEQLLVFSG